MALRVVLPCRLARTLEKVVGAVTRGAFRGRTVAAEAVVSSRGMDFGGEGQWHADVVLERILGPSDNWSGKVIVRSCDEQHGSLRF